MLRRTLSGAAATLLAAGILAALTPPAAAGPSASSDMLAALQRDLGLTADQVQARLAADERASTAERTLRGTLGTSFAGAWLAGGADVVVAVTDAAGASRVRAAGATPRVVAHSERELTAVKDGLDARAGAAPASVTGWYVDVVTNTVVVEALAGGAEAARAFAGSGSAVRVATAAEAPRTLYDVRGGDAYYINNSSRCSIGFSVAGGFVTAGHCGGAGSSTAGSNRVAQGTVQARSFPGNDYGWVAVNSNWVPRNLVNRYNGGTVTVTGSTEAAVGASICRSGSTTGWRCGTVQAKNQTVRYSQGSVGGLTRTNACAEPGDSGGSWLSGSQAQGVTSGGSGNCSSGGTTYFQPVNEILSTYGLRLVTS
jgi:streptogrisin C